MKMESGGGGLVSTAPDYARFMMMLRNGGQLDNWRYLSPRTLEYMTANQLDAAVQRTPLYLPGPDYGFRLRFAVRTSTGEAADQPGRRVLPGRRWWHLYVDGPGLRPVRRVHEAKPEAARAVPIDPAQHGLRCADRVTGPGCTLIDQRTLPMAVWMSRRDSGRVGG